MQMVITFVIAGSSFISIAGALTVPRYHRLLRRDDANQQYTLQCPGPMNPDCKTQGYCAGAMYVAPIEIPGVSAAQAEMCTPQGCQCVPPYVRETQTSFLGL